MDILPFPRQHNAHRGIHTSKPKHGAHATSAHGSPAQRLLIQVCAYNISIAEARRGNTIMCKATVKDAQYITITKPILSLGSTTVYLTMAEVTPLRQREAGRNVGCTTWCTMCTECD